MNDELLGQADAYALGTLTDAQRRGVAADLAAADDETRAAFVDEVRLIRETLAAVSGVGAIAPPPLMREQLMARVETEPVDDLEARRRARRMRQVLLAAAAVVVVALGALFAVRAVTNDDAPAQITAQEVLDEPDVQATTASLPSGGALSVNYSKAADALVLVMQDVPAPPPDANYQMWLGSESGQAVSAGTMSAQDVSPTTTVVVGDIGSANQLMFTVEPPGGSPAPTSEPIAVISFV
ncbi:anti-sigma factor [Aldersonia kunmingensis]|uniref:anti-sigma factor n=1 Tax=Aldersonia kunmingensis TaxID=408066 RepID=UPI00083077B7|nr:anti-sigma factor [Aldersonia kunmingensis]